MPVILLREKYAANGKETYKGMFFQDLISGKEKIPIILDTIYEFRWKHVLVFFLSEYSIRTPYSMKMW